MSTQSADSIPVSVTVAIPPADSIPADVVETAAQLGVLQHVPQVVELTREVYGGFSEISVSDNPDFGDTHIVFRVPVRCSIEQSLDLDEEWDRGISKIIPHSPQVYLTSTKFLP